MTPDVAEEIALLSLCQTLARKMVRLERDGRRAVSNGEYQYAATLWGDREAVQHRRSYVLRQLWARQRKYARA